MRLPPRFMDVLLFSLIVSVGIAFALGTSPVLGLVGIIIGTTGMIVRMFVRRNQDPMS